MKKALMLTLMLALMSTLFLAGCAQTDENGAENEQPGEQPGEQPNDKKDVTITFGVTPWTSTVPPTYVAKEILEEAGYTVELQSAEAGVVYAGLAEGDIDLFMDAWLPDTHKNYMDKYGDKLEDLAVSYTEGELGWVVPKYLEDINSMDDLKGNEDMFDNKIYGIDEGAGLTATSREAIEGYGFDFDYVTANEAAMMAQAKREIAKENPVLFVGWRPHSMFAKWDLKVLTDSKGYFKTSEVHVLANNGFKDKAPEAYEILKNWSIPVGDVEAMILEIDGGADETETAQKWIQNNQDKVNEILGK